MGEKINYGLCKVEGCAALGLCIGRKQQEADKKAVTKDSPVEFKNFFVRYAERCGNKGCVEADDLVSSAMQIEIDLGVRKA